jgi:hypothetical protein
MAKIQYNLQNMYMEIVLILWNNKMGKLLRQIYVHVFFSFFKDIWIFVIRNGKLQSLLSNPVFFGFCEKMEVRFS